jgi:oxygen-independent coproporphyrinogen-3 oxidase
MCHFETDWSEDRLKFPELQEGLSKLKEMENDGLLILTENGLTVTEKGRPYIRNICMAFDLRLNRKKPTTQLFSMTI